jgi:hypothetical protein
LETEPAASHDSTPPESTTDQPDEPVRAVPTKETTPVWAQTNPAAPAHKKGDPDWSKTEKPASENGGKSSPAWAATVPSSPGTAAEVEENPRPDEGKAVESTEPPAVAPLTDPPKAVAADAMKSTWPPASASSPAPPEETDIWPPEPPTERAMPAWPPLSEMDEPETPAEAIPSWPDESFERSAATAAATSAPVVEAAAPAPSASVPPTIPPEHADPAPAPAASTATVQPAVTEPPAPTVASKPPSPTMPVTPAPAPEPAPAPAAEPAPVRPSQSGPPARPAWAPSPTQAESPPPVAKAPSATQMQIPAWAPRVPLASQPGTPTWFSPKEEIPHATAQPIAQPAPSPQAEPATPVVGGQLPVAQIPVAPQPRPAAQPAKTTWEVVEQPRKSGPHAPVQAGPTAEDRSYAEWFAWAKRGGAPASACHAAAQGAFKALSSGKDVNTAVQWATAAMSQPPEQVSSARQQYCAWFALANIDLNLDQHRAHLFSAAAIQALDAGADASAAHAAGLAAAGIR